MKKYFNAFLTIMAVLIAAIIVEFTSCSDDIKIPDQDPLRNIIGKKWYASITGPDYYLEFKEDGTYICTLGDETAGGIYYNEMNINGMYSIREIEETTEDDPKYPSTLFKMMVSGSNNFDQLWVYHYIVSGDGHVPAILVHFYSGNELFRIRGFTSLDSW